jgi:uncharacterized ion transporter superfamily protein YfcC
MVCMACGFDSILAVALLFCSSAIGYASGMTQAFSVGIAQTIAELPMFSGIGFRFVSWGVFVTASCIYMMWYAHRIKKDPTKAYNFEIDKKFRDQEHFDPNTIEKISGRQAAILVIFFGTFIFVAFSVIKWGFYIDEMTAIFLISGIICAIIGRVSPSKTADAFVDGAKDFVWAGLIIGMCFTVSGILGDAGIMDTIVNAIIASLIMSITCGIATPWAVCYMMKFIVGHAIIDGKRMTFTGSGGDLFGQWIKWFLLTIITCGIYSFWVIPRMYKWIAEHIHAE